MYKINKYNKKILIVYLNNNFFYEKLFLDFLKNTSNISKVISIPSKQKMNLNKLIYYFRFYKLKAFIYLVFNNLICKLKKEVKKEFKKKEIEHKEFDSFDNFRSEILNSKNLDLIISTVDFKIEKELLSIPKDGWLNIHFGDLRRYRGINSPFWTMLNEEEEFTMTIHLMGLDYDNGPIITERNLKNNQQHFFKTIRLLFSMASEELYRIYQNYNKIYDAKIINLKNSKYFSEPKIEDSKKFLKKGFKFI